MKTYSAKPGEVPRNWWVVDAEGKNLGRLATEIADVLRGKNKPRSAPRKRSRRVGQEKPQGFPECRNLARSRARS